MLICFMVFICANDSIGMYYQKHMNHTWIRKRRKVAKALVVEYVLFVSVITINIVMTRKIVSDSDLSGH